MRTLNLHTSAHVFCNNEPCGTLDKVVVDPQDDRITDIIIERGAPNKTGRVVPVSVVTEATETAIYLGVSAADLDRYPAYRLPESQVPEYRAPEAQVPEYGADQSPQPADTASQAYPTIGSDSGVDVPQGMAAGQGVSRRGVPSQGATGVLPGDGAGLPLAPVASGMPVLSEGARLATVDRVIADRTTGELTHLILRRGTTPHYRVLPASGIAAVDEHGVTLGPTLWDTLHRYEPRDDSEIRSAVKAGLVRSEIDFSALGVEVDGGVVALTGLVPSDVALQEARAIATAERGVVDLKLAVITDTDLIRRLARVLQRSRQVKKGIIDIASKLGTITIEGHVESRSVRKRVGSLIAAQAGVRSVINRLEIGGCDGQAPLIRGDHGVIYHLDAC